VIRDEVALSNRGTRQFRIDRYVPFVHFDRAGATIDLFPYERLGDVQELDDPALSTRMQQDLRARSPLNELRAAALFAKLAVSPRAALRNLASMQSDWADRALRPHVLRHARAARARYEQLVADAVARGELRADTDAPALARMIEVTLGGSFLAWTLYREGPAAKRFREDLDTTLRPYLARGAKRSRFARTTVDAKLTRSRSDSIRKS
jgi:tetracycline repressor-like protein